MKIKNFIKHNKMKVPYITKAPGLKKQNTQRANVLSYTVTRV